MSPEALQACAASAVFTPPVEMISTVAPDSAEAASSGAMPAALQYAVAASSDSGPGGRARNSTRPASASCSSSCPTSSAGTLEDTSIVSCSTVRVPSSSGASLSIDMPDRTVTLCSETR